MKAAETKLARRLQPASGACAALALALSAAPAVAQDKAAADAGAAAGTQARAQIAPLKGSGVRGQVTFQHAGPFISIQGSVSGLGKGKHGLHVHEGTSCEKPGSHYNPGGTPHGSPDQPANMRHVGDLGNLVASQDGTAQYSRTDALARLDGPRSIVGKVLVVHPGEDDYLSQPSGNSGEPVACGVIRGRP